VFHPWAFLLGLLGVFGAVILVPIAHAYFADRLGLAAPVAAGFTGLSAAAFAGALGAVAGARCRRLAFYELFAVSLLWSAFTAGLVILGAARAPGFLAGLAAQGPLVYALAVGGVGHLATIAALVGASLSFLLTGTGTGRADLSFSYEWYVARSHLRLSPKMLAALFGVVVVGVAPGVVFVVVWSLVREVEERRAYRRGELVRSPRLPATLLMTLFSMAAVALGVWTLVVVLSVMSGFSQDLKSKILGHTAHGMVLSYGQDDFGDWREVRRKTLSVPGVTGATPFTYSEVMASSGQNLTGAIVKGIDEASVGSVIDLPKSIQSGRLEWLAHPEQIPRLEREGEKAPPPGGKPLPGVLLGRQLALSLRAQVGDVVDVLSPFGDLGPTGPQPKSRPFRVAGIFYSGMYEYDSKFAYVDLAEAQRFFGLSSVTGLEVKVKDVDAARATMDKVVFALGQWPYYAKDWGDLNRSLFAALQQEKVVMAVILGFMVLVTTFTIIATLIMMVLEKRREIAVLKSMGAGVAAIMRVFVIEGLVLGGVGVLFGLVLGLGTCLLIDKVGIPLNPEIYYIHNLPVVLDAGQIAGVVVAALVFSFLATLYPASKAARLHPVDGLRSE
jgi:lipoprotein-releasing system permease protein